MADWKSIALVAAAMAAALGEPRSAPCGPSGSLRSGNPTPTARANLVAATDGTKPVPPLRCRLSKYINRESQNEQNREKYYCIEYKYATRVDLYDIIWYNHARKPPTEVIDYA